MWEKQSEYNYEDIRAVSYKSRVARICESYDMGIFFGSYEARALLSSSLIKKGHCEKSIIVLFNEKDDIGLRRKNDRLLVKQVKRCSRTKPIIIRCDIKGIERNLDNIEKSIPMNLYDKGCRWFIDSSGAPKPYTLSLISRLHNKISAPLIEIFHPTGDYEKLVNDDSAYTFTRGESEYIWIHGYEGFPDIKRKWSFFFLLGFEGERSYGTLYRFEPSDVWALIGSPGYKPQYYSEARKRNRTFLDEGKPKIIEANAADAVETFKKIERQLGEITKRYNCCIIPLGSKPHAIGAALASLCHKNVGIMYLLPRKWNYRNIVEGKTMWKYHIEF
jgi:hypothetical protein